MSAQLDGIHAALTDLVSAMEAKADARDKSDQSMADALAIVAQGVQAALTELVAAYEAKPGGTELPNYDALVDRIVASIKAVTIQSPAVELRPTIKVAAPQVNVSPKLDVTVAAGPNHITMPEPTVTVMEAPRFKKLEVDFQYRGAFIVGATISTVE